MPKIASPVLIILLCTSLIVPLARAGDDEEERPPRVFEFDRKLDAVVRPYLPDWFTRPRRVSSYARYHYYVKDVPRPTQLGEIQIFVIDPRGDRFLVQGNRGSFELITGKGYGPNVYDVYPVTDQKELMRTTRPGYTYYRTAAIGKETAAFYNLLTDSAGKHFVTLPVDPLFFFQELWTRRALKRIRNAEPPDLSPYKLGTIYRTFTRPATFGERLVADLGPPLLLLAAAPVLPYVAFKCVQALQALGLL
jgi:hypothetical protein